MSSSYLILDGTNNIIRKKWRFVLEISPFLLTKGISNLVDSRHIQAVVNVLKLSVASLFCVVLARGYGACMLQDHLPWASETFEKKFGFSSIKAKRKHRFNINTSTL